MVDVGASAAVGVAGVAVFEDELQAAASSASATTPANGARRDTLRSESIGGAYAAPALGLRR